MQYLKQEREQDVDYLTQFEQNTETIRQLTQENKTLQRKAFDSIVRKVIDSGMVYLQCNHKHVTLLDKRAQNPRKLVPESHLDQYSDLEYSIFYAQCNNCMLGVNRHDCSVEGETYYFTCDEARVINNLARQYGILGSIQTATKVRD